LKLVERLAVEFDTTNKSDRIRVDTLIDAVEEELALASPANLIFVERLDEETADDTVSILSLIAVVNPDEVDATELTLLDITDIIAKSAFVEATADRVTFNGIPVDIPEELDATVDIFPDNLIFVEIPDVVVEVANALPAIGIPVERPEELNEEAFELPERGIPVDTDDVANEVELTDTTRGIPVERFAVETVETEDAPDANPDAIKRLADDAELETTSDANLIDVRIFDDVEETSIKLAFRLIAVVIEEELDTDALEFPTRGIPVERFAELLAIDVNTDVILTSVAIDATDPPTFNKLALRYICVLRLEEIDDTAFDAPARLILVVISADVDSEAVAFADRLTGVEILPLDAEIADVLPTRAIPVDKEDVLNATDDKVTDG
jgi:hypothetical protein